MEKICTRCKVSKPFAAFGRRKAALYPWCRACVSEKNAEYRAANRDKILAAKKRRYANNSERIKAANAAWVAANSIKAKTTAKAWVEANRDRVNARNVRWVAANPERMQAARTAWKLANPERLRETARAYRKAVPAKIQAWQSRRRAARLQATPEWSNFSAIQAAYEAADLLMQVTGDWYEVDHIVPLRGVISRSHVVCGLHVDYNLQVIPRSDNRRKSNTQWPDMPGKGN